MSAEQLSGLSKWMETELARWKVPGIGVAVVQDGEVILAEGYGYRNLESKDPVTAETLFAIGSASKAFTGMSVALMVDDGKLEWDQPVRKYLPTFDLKDSFAASRMSPRDLLCHRSGLPRHDLMWYGSPLTREELFERLVHLEPTRDFRTNWQYQNLMYLTAGYLAGKMAGSSWEAVVEERIFKPLGMNKSNFSVDVMQQSDNAALPYRLKDDVAERIPYRNIDQIGPAGSINSSVLEMSNWVKLMLNNGKFGDQQILSEANARELYKSQMLIDDPLFHMLTETNYLAYGLGWFVQDYRGNLVVHHGGNIDGFSAMVGFIPASNIGVVLLTNLNSNYLTMATMFHIYDCLLGLEQREWGASYKEKFDNLMKMQEDGIEKMLAARKPDTTPSHALEDYAGKFEHPAYGVLEVRVEDGVLKGVRNSMEFTYEHHHYDVFVGRSPELEGAAFLTSFQTDVEGTISSAGIMLQPGVSDIVFKRVTA